MNPSPLFAGKGPFPTETIIGGQQQLNEAARLLYQQAHEFLQSIIPLDDFNFVKKIRALRMNPTDPLMRNQLVHQGITGEIQIRCALATIEDVALKSREDRSPQKSLARKKPRWPS